MSGVPRLSHLQFLVVGLLRHKTFPGREIRESLKGFGIRKSGPAFYQLMSRLEDAGLVVGNYHQEIIDGQLIRERHYTITADGTRVWKGSRDFYVDAIRNLEGLEGLARA